MTSSYEAIISHIKDVHEGDEKQLEVVLSKDKKIIVEAPAGYGKTKTLISRLAYLIATNQAPHPKKICALTFSVNAAYKLKKEIAQNLPGILSSTAISPDQLNKRLVITNYHGLCRRILGKYGYLLHNSLRDLSVLKHLDESSSRTISASLKLAPNTTEAVVNFANAISNVDRAYANVSENRKRYVDSIITDFLPNGFLPHNSVILLTIELLNRFSEIKKFYHKYFSCIVVDEFQDTNILSWGLIKALVAEDSNVLFLGDPLQRIYGFLGAMPGLLEESRQKYDMTVIRLDRNYRFRSNPDMLNLDKNIRANAANPANPRITEQAIVPCSYLGTQNEEASWIASKISSLRKEDPTSRIAILVKQRGINTDRIVEKLKDSELNPFVCLFADEDETYKSFHAMCFDHFEQHIGAQARISWKHIAAFAPSVIEACSSKQNDPTIGPLLSILSVAFEVIPKEYSHLSLDERIELIKDVLRNSALKQFIEYVKTDVSIVTVHGSKGLEWDYVFLPDLEKSSFPSYRSICQTCKFTTNCLIEITPENEKKYLEELSVFYVAVTRARNQVYFSASKSQVTNYGGEVAVNPSCFLRMKGIKLVRAKISEAKE